MAYGLYAIRASPYSRPVPDVGSLFRGTVAILLLTGLALPSWLAVFTFQPTGTADQLSAFAETLHRSIAKAFF